VHPIRAASTQDVLDFHRNRNCRTRRLRRRP
jgi:hypothetical protein